MPDEKLLVIVDADTLAGWRRAEPSLAQLQAAVADLRAQAPEAEVAIVGDPSLKWALSEPEREALELAVANRWVVFAPAGTIEGHVGFMARIVAKATQQGYTPVALTDRSVPGARLGRVRREGEKWVFDLSGDLTPTVTAARPAPRRRRGRSR